MSLFGLIFGSEKVPLFVRVGSFSIPAGLYRWLMPQRLQNYLAKKERQKPFKKRGSR